MCCTISIPTRVGNPNSIPYATRKSFHITYIALDSSENVKSPILRPSMHLPSPSPPPNLTPAYTQPPPLLPLPRFSHPILNPNPAIQVRYLSTMVAHSSAGCSLLENSMHSSRAAFSSLQTQHGWGGGQYAREAGIWKERGAGLLG